MARIESGSAFHVFAAKYRKDLRPRLVLLILGNESMFVPFKLYFVSFTLSKFAMGVGALSWNQIFIVINEICPEMHANEIHELYDRHHKVSPDLNSQQNTHNSVKHEVI